MIPVGMVGDRDEPAGSSVGSVLEDYRMVM